MSSEDSNFCLNNYDCIGFDMDHTMVQYNLPEIFRLLYRCVVDYLVKEKNHSSATFHMENFENYEDFSLRGIVFDILNGNFVKLDKDGYVLRCTHGLRECSDEEIVKYYGTERKWPLFHTLRKKVYHGDGYLIMENFFLMPIASIIGQLVEEADLKNNGIPLTDYSSVHKEAIEGLGISFHPSSFKNNVGQFFPSLKKEPEKYIKKLPESVHKWIKYLRKQGKVVALITDSFADFACHLMEYAVGPNWKEDFDFIIAHSNKPNFFTPSFKERCFVNVNEMNEETNDVQTSLKPHTLYTLGNAWKFVETIKEFTGKDDVKMVYFGDSMKSDVYPPCHFAGWDTVAVLEELEAEEVHFHRNNSNAFQSKRPKITPLLKEEKLIVASSQWGSFFTHPDSRKANQNGSLSSERNEINTFWGDIIRKYSKLAIPLLDYLAETPIEQKLPIFTDDQFGFYPSAPRSLLKDSCEDAGQPECTRQNK